MIRPLLFAVALLPSSTFASTDLPAWLEWVHRAEMRAVESGMVEQVPVDEGQHVEAGDLLLRMDQRQAKAALTEAKAKVARAQLELARAQREVDRSQELFDRGLIAIEELREAELALAAARADKDSALGALAAAEVALEHTELRAPFDGVVVERNAWQGAVIFRSLQSRPLVVVAPNDRMIARALVTADVLRRFRPGQSAMIRLSDGTRRGTVYRLGVEAVRVELKGAVYHLDVVFPRRPDEVLRPSEKVRLVLP